MLTNELPPPQELSKLQDRVPAFPSEKAIKIVEEELGAPLSTLYRTFDRRPIAGASLGQVCSPYLQCPLPGLVVDGPC